MIHEHLTAFELWNPIQMHKYVLNVNYVVGNVLGIEIKKTWPLSSRSSQCTVEDRQ